MLMTSTMCGEMGMRCMVCNGSKRSLQARRDRLLLFKGGTVSTPSCLHIGHRLFLFHVPKHNKWKSFLQQVV